MTNIKKSTKYVYKKDFQTEKYTGRQAGRHIQLVNRQITKDILEIGQTQGHKYA